MSVENYILNAFQVAGNASSEFVVGMTKSFNNVVGSSPVDSFMDAAAGYGHRIVHGHSLEYLPQIFEKYGFSGIGDAFTHWLRDLSSPHGVPLPFANEIRDFFGMNFKEATQWLSLNIGDLIGGGLSVFHSYSSFKVLKIAVASGYLSPVAAFGILIGGVMKVTSGIILHNPVTLSAGIFDMGAFLWGLSPFYSLGWSYFKKPIVAVPNVSQSILVGALFGVVSASLFTWLMNYSKSEKSCYMENIIIGAAAGAGIGAISEFANLSMGAVVGLSMIGSGFAVAGKDAIKDYWHEIKGFSQDLFKKSGEYTYCLESPHYKIELKSVVYI